MGRYCYLEKIQNFIDEKNELISGIIIKNSDNADEAKSQQDAWLKQIEILKAQLFDYKDGTIVFEYSIPRLGKRVDNVFIYKNIIFIMEFKTSYENSSQAYLYSNKQQVDDYVYALKTCHKDSKNKIIVPVLICTEAENVVNEITKNEYKNSYYNVILCNKDNLKNEIEKLINYIEENDSTREDVDVDKWIKSSYEPTPTLIEAIHNIFNKRSESKGEMNDLSTSAAGEKELDKAASELVKIIDDCKNNNKKAICFLTGVPGAGKTFVGMDVTSRVHNDVTFLSGNGPLVKVLQEVLKRANKKIKNKKMTDEEKKENQLVNVYVQNIHNFRNDYFDSQNPPHEHVAIFDEAQRSWDEEHFKKWMQQKKHISVNTSESGVLIDYMNRHKDWSVVICLVGGGQEINSGESGIKEWFKVLKNKKFDDWNLYLSKELRDSEYVKEDGKNVIDLLDGIKSDRIFDNENLHLNVSLRTHQAENLSAFVKAVLDINIDKAKNIYKEMSEYYPIYLTRNLETAKNKLMSMSKEFDGKKERYGLLAASKALRLRKFGIDVNDSVDIVNWILNSEEDVRSSYALEQAATEFDIQGLEIEYGIVGWDADLRFDKLKNKWEHYSFRGTKWMKKHKIEDKNFLLNAYRVILTRCRQGMIIYVPIGDEDVHSTSYKGLYDGTFEYLKEIGLDII